jgi:enoyl-CoA hydratase
VAADNARLGVPEIRLGLLPGAGGTQRLPRLLPRGIALQMLLTGAPLGAVDAHRLGLVNELSGDAPALEVAERLAREIATGPPLAHGAAKHLVQRSALLSLTDAIDLERETVAGLFATDDAAEGPAAFPPSARPSSEVADTARSSIRARPQSVSRGSAPGAPPGRTDRCGSSYSRTPRRRHG